jgi:hypothetical protein
LNSFDTRLLARNAARPDAERAARVQTLDGHRAADVIMQHLRPLAQDHLGSHANENRERTPDPCG